MKKFVSIVTPTKNRAPLLKKCLASLQRQTQQLDELVIVDNGSTDETQKVIADFKRVLPIRSLRVTSHGYPKLYNAGIAVARGNWVVFFDDDCVASVGWFAAIKKTITTFPRAVIQGKTLSIPKNNLYAEVMGDHYKNWLKSNMISDCALRTFDNKNLCVPRYVFDECGLFNEYLFFGSEDIDLGFRIHEKGIPILYDESLLAYHTERTTFQGFLQQHIRIARSEGYVDKYVRHSEKISMFPIWKILRHLKSAVMRELLYIHTLQVRNALLLPVLYGMLFIIRVWGYTTVQKNT